MDKSAAVFSGSLLNAECAMLVADVECDALCGLMPPVIPPVVCDP